ncbi:MAG TPA: hemerythrin domain-containing protein [Polyangia bacterium]
MTLPVTPTPTQLFAAARANILVQHDDLRERLHGAMATARAAGRGDATARADLSPVIVLIIGALGNHMGYEESVLFPVLRGKGDAGRAQMAAIQADHKRQRAEFATLLELAREGDPDALALVLQSFVADVLIDMDSEEGLLARERFPETPPATPSL